MLTTAELTGIAALVLTATGWFVNHFLAAKREKEKGALRDGAPRLAIPNLLARLVGGYPSYLGVAALPSEQPSAFLKETATEVMGLIHQVPPLSRSAFAKEAFVGRWVQWEGDVLSVSEGDACYTIHVVDKPPNWVMLTFPRNQRKNIEGIRERDWVRYEAQILSIDAHIEVVKPVILEHERPGRGLLDL